MSGTHVFYNGVELRDCDTKSFEQKVVYDETTGQMLNQYRISVESLVYGFFNAAPSTPSTTDQLLSHPSTTITKTQGNTATDRMHIIQKLLNEPRKDFWYATHGGKREDVEESIYQILLAATGSDLGDAENPKFFQDVLGNDITVKYKADYNDGGGSDPEDTGKINRLNVIDTNNGPHPKQVRVTEVIGGRAFRILFEIEVHVHHCIAQESEEVYPEGVTSADHVVPSEFVISNTWSSQETCDDSWRRSRVIEGTLRVMDQRHWAHGFRQLCLPGLLDGYRRISQRFASDPTNLVLKYRIEDKQAEAAPPWPAIDWKMNHIDSAKNEYGAIERQLNLTLIGLPKIDRSLLIGKALQILNARFPGASSGVTDADALKEVRPVSFIRQALVITQGTDRPEVELLCNIRLHTAGVGGYESALASSSANLAIAGYNPNQWPAPRPYDSASPAGIFACYLQRPCNQYHGLPEAQFIDLEDYGTANIPRGTTEDIDPYWLESDYAEYVSPDPLTPSADVNRDDHTSHPYTHVDIDTRYSKNEGNIVLPLSKLRNINEDDEEEDPVWESIAVIPVHSGVLTRTITVNATRIGLPPELPDPAEMLIDPNGVVERLVGQSDIVIDAPHATQDQQHRIFSAQCRLTYALARPLVKTERFRSANNMALRTDPGHNWLTGYALFSKGRVEHHNTGYGSEVTAPTQEPGDGYTEPV